MGSSKEKNKTVEAMARNFSSESSEDDVRGERDKYRSRIDSRSNNLHEMKLIHQILMEEIEQNNRRDGMDIVVMIWTTKGPARGILKTKVEGGWMIVKIGRDLEKVVMKMES